MSSKTPWVSLADLPHNANATNLIYIGNNEIATADATTETANSGSGILVYNTISNQWRVDVKFPKDFISQNHSICYNPSTKILWLFGDHHKMVNVNMETKEFKIIKPDARYVGYYPRLLIINDKLHVICGSDNKHHLVWNENKNEFDKELFTFPAFIEGVYGHGVVYAKKKNVLYFFGGYDYGKDDGDYAIWKCEIDKGYKWIELKVKLNEWFYSKGYVLTKDEKYIVIFQSLDRICLFDVDKEVFINNKVESRRVEEAKVMHAVLSSNGDEEMIVNGYARGIVKEFDIMIPNELIVLILKYYMTEMVYAIHSDKGFYKIALSDVLSLVPGQIS